MKKKIPTVPTVRELAERLVFTWVKTGTESRELLTDLIIAAIMDDRERQVAPLRVMVEGFKAEIQKVASETFPRKPL